MNNDYQDLADRLREEATQRWWGQHPRDVEPSDLMKLAEMLIHLPKDTTQHAKAIQVGKMALDIASKFRAAAAGN